MTNKTCGLLFLLITTSASAAWPASSSQFAIKEFHKGANGITFRTAGGTMRVELCGDRVVHVVASPTSTVPSPKVPVVIQPCRASKLEIKADKSNVRISSAAITVAIDSATGAVSFLSKDGKVVLAEPNDGGKAFDLPSLYEAKSWQLQQSFLSPSDEAQYGLGQHQEGIFNVRGVPIRLA